MYRRGRLLLCGEGAVRIPGGGELRPVDDIGHAETAAGHQRQLRTGTAACWQGARRPPH